MVLRTVLISGVLALAGLLACAQAVEACSCMGTLNETREQVKKKVRRQADAAAAVFIAEVIASDMVGGTLRVEKIWKGKIGPEVRMRHATPMPDGTIQISSCDVEFEKGKRYLVFGDRVSRELMNAGECGFTGPVEMSARTLEMLEEIFRRPVF